MSNNSAAAEKAAQQNKEMNEYIRSKVVSGRIEIAPSKASAERSASNAKNNAAIRSKAGRRPGRIN